MVDASRAAVYTVGMTKNMKKLVAWLFMDLKFLERPEAWVKANLQWLDQRWFGLPLYVWVYAVELALVALLVFSDRLM